jgi:DNA ligase D-like protein (predicted ligase)
MIRSKSESPRLSFIEPLLPSSAPVAPEGDDWIHELKHDGYRTLLVVNQDRVRAFTRRGNDWTDIYQPIVAAAAKLRCRSAIIDGEVIVQNEDGLADFLALKLALNRDRSRLVFFAFDLLHLNGEDLRREPLVARRERLRRLIGKNRRSRIQFSDHVVGNGPTFYAAAEKLGAEGIVSKRASSRYRSGRSRDWLKIKCFTEATMPIVGTETDSRGIVEALLAKESDGGLEYAGKAMITLSGADRQQLWERLKRAHVEKAPLAGLSRLRKPDGHWFRPKVRVAVRHLRGEGGLRHASVHRLLTEREGQ